MDGGHYVKRMDCVSLRPRSNPIRLSVNLTGLNTPSCDQEAVAFQPVIATAGSDVIGRGRADFGRSAKLSNCKDER